MSRNLVIVTAASSNHFVPLGNLLFSLDVFEPGTRVVIYDIGLAAVEKAELGGREVRTFDFGAYPDHVRTAHCAWKPFVFLDVLREVKGPLLWLDAGDLVHDPLYRIRKLLETRGFYTPLSSDSIGRWTHPRAIERMEATDLVTKRSRNGAIVGMTEAQMSLAERWAALSTDPECMCPPGSSRANHRYDQSILSVLAYRSGVPLDNEKRDVSTHNDRLSHADVVKMLCFHT